MNSSIRFNAARWEELCAKARFPASANSFFADLSTRCHEPHRAYHNAEHIAECLAEFDQVRSIASDPVAIELAIWFHDAIYDPRASDNEEQSAALARNFLFSNAAPPELASIVQSLILATKTHYAAPNTDAALLIDIDLSILGKPPARYARYESAIREEYNWVPWQTYATKRAEILRKFLSRPHLFSTREIRLRYEPQARENLAKAVQNLTGKEQP